MNTEAEALRLAEALEAHPGGGFGLVDRRCHDDPLGAEPCPDCNAPAAPAQERKTLTADDIREPKNGEKWRVVWWNESCRMMLPAAMALDGFQSYKNGTLQFTLKRRAHGIGTTE